MIRFDPANFAVFSYTAVAVDATSGTIPCSYRWDGEDRAIAVEERVVVGPVPAAVWRGPRGAAQRRVARLLWLAAGPSYYKTAAPPLVRIPDTISPAEHAWLEALYREGLGEFAYHNGIDLSLRPAIDVQIAAGAAPVSGLGLPRRSLVPVGGGKDSCVTIDVLQAAGDDMVLWNVGGHRAARDVASACGLPLAVAHRVLDPGLGELNASGALNGHVPVTAVVSLVAVAQALVTGADQIVFSNERSADTANLTYHGLPVNHQYSKGMAAERSLRAVLGGVTCELEYFSLLRPLSELRIAELFARGERFLPVFTSCNAAFRLDARRRVERWCGACPKCRFVFLALAPFLARARLLEIFGSDLLADPAHLGGYRELLGLAGHRPFECVGEVDECRAALQMIAADEQWAAAPLVRQLLAELQTADLVVSDHAVAAIMAPGTRHCVPAVALRALRDALEPSPVPR
ncbi:MAG TPA: hypothetical protein VK891_06795 [Euzebyales bacterium]|nr:hypothetical protein [Euzebyales bacterium]